MKLLFVVLFLKETRLEATLEDQDGKRRRVGLSWKLKEPTPVPPEHWWKQVQAEIEFQRAEAHARSTGRVLR